ncbi:MAG: cyclic nucleotide-binding domain-containing protein [Acidobacteria bacterium]|nr:cyclic nucleotide-binding domain-containing protein [Acidobacteriota bacterium]
MRIPFFEPKIEHLDLYLARRAYDKALGAIGRELRRRPDDLPLRRRKADLLRQTGETESAVEALQDLAQRYVSVGFHARAIALYKEILELDPERAQIHRELAALIGTESPREEPRLEAREEDPEARARELAASSLFTLFDTDALEEVLTSTSLRVFQEGDIIVTEGEEGLSLFLIVDGSVKIFTRGQKGEHLPLAALGAGALFGEVSVVYGKPRTATVTASSPVTAIEISKEEIDRIARAHPNVRTVLKRFCEERAANAISVLTGARSGD